jgi:hypothetical protein
MEDITPEAITADEVMLKVAVKKAAAAKKPAAPKEPKSVQTKPKK